MVIINGGLKINWKDRVNEKIINIPRGELGTFDEHGVMPTSLININNQIFLYYIGWNLATSVPFRNAIGLAISNDGGEKFEKYSKYNLGSFKIEKSNIRV